MRFGLLLLAGGLFFIWMGGRDIYEAAASGGQRTLTYTQFVQKRPGMGWYKVTGAGWDLADCMYMTTTSKYSQDETVTSVYLPVHAANVAPGSNEKISVVLETEREDLKNFLQQAEKSTPGSMPTPPDNVLHYSGNLDGTVEFGGDLGSDAKDKLKEKLGAQLDPNYVVIRDGTKPNGWMGFLKLIGGIVALILGCAVLGGRRR